MKKFLKQQTAIFEDYGIVYRSVNIQLSWNDAEKKFKKKPIGMPAYKDIRLETSFDPSKNAIVVPLGKRYGGLIGVDVDNKNGTIEFFNELASDNDFELETLSVKTINDGMHYYFKLNDDQMKELDTFMSSTALCFSTPDKQRNIDIKYTNQVLFASSYLDYDGEIYKYEVKLNCEPVELPDYLYKEILRTHKQQCGNVKKIKAQKSKQKGKIDTEKVAVTNDDAALTTAGKEKVVIKETTVNENKIPILRRYLNCLGFERFDNRDDWVRLGAIIFNECGLFDLFDEYSKKSHKYDRDECIKLWNSFKQDREKKATIKKLIEMAELDNFDMFKRVLFSDTDSMLDILYEHGPSDLHMAYLFYGLNKHRYVYDTINEHWYYINNYGIYIIDKKGDVIISKVDSLKPIIKKEYLALQSMTNDDDKSATLSKRYYNLIKYITSSRDKENLLKELRRLFIVDKIYEKMDSVNPNLLGFDNGVLDLLSGHFRNAKPDEYISVTTGYDYKKADPQLKDSAMKIFSSMFPDKKELAYVLKHISLGLYGSNPEEKFYIWIGSGGNGKGLLRDIIKVVFGSYFDPLEISYLYKGAIIRPDAPDPAMASKKNTRLIVTTEPEGDVCLKSSVIKSKFSGNDPISVRALYSNTFSFIPKYKLIIQTNNEPTFIGFDGGMKRRPILIRFPCSFVEKPGLPHERQIDKDLKNKIVNEKLYLYEFLEIFIEHYKLYLKEKLVLPPRFEQDTKTFIKNNAPIDEWLETDVEKTGKPTDTERASILYDSFLSFMEGDTRGITQLSFKNYLATLGIQQKRKNQGNYYLGIKLKKNNAPHPDLL